MSTSKAAIVESISSRHLRGLPSRARRAQTTQRLEKIKEMASTLLEEAESLEHENAMAEASASIKNLTAQSAIDFYEEVKRFEIRLIQRALEIAGGNQARAARMLGLGATTLNYKVKTYQLV